jgi:HSP20 family protein
MDRVMGRNLTGEVQRVGGGAYPPVNILDGQKDVLVQCETPGLKREDLELSITGETLTIKGAKRPMGDDDVAYQRRERPTGDFVRTIMLPEPVDADKVQAKLDAGVLTVLLPKTQAAMPRRIEVK